MAMGGAGRDAAFYLSRNFDHKRELVWRAFTNPADLQLWWAPKGATMVGCTGYPRAGSMFLFGYQSRDTGEIWGRQLYREIYPPSQLIYTESATDSRGNPIQHPMRHNWPVEILTTVNFAKAGNGTALSLRSLPQNATDAQRGAFDDGRYDMKNSTVEMFERLDNYLGSLE